ncbi:predicted protein [Histoplasma mississippiense (nom. inval.)]|uniref:predicted protein n=1 Tax=Ajellomyces capsulatus (strain NAm1 / WU24) TaxID=2059318 RepID=UPI000157B2C6|nr:predicted protein [Histoplasma mississippiense (nom. inval.)]EDN02303.1 predicted protein [Histoplasma mississippiense (nom. inval.)]
MKAALPEKFLFLSGFHKNNEISKYRSPQIDLKEAVYSLAAAVLYARHSQYVESLEEHTDVLRRGSSLLSRAPVWFNIGSLWASVGDLRRALDAYELSINEDREFTISWFSKGVCHFLLREYCESMITFRKCSSTFKMFSQVTLFDDYSLDFVLVKDDVVWNANVAKRRYKMQSALCGVDDLESKLRRGHLNLFLGPHKDCFKLDEMFLKKGGSRLKGALSLIPRPLTIRKRSCHMHRKFAYVGFSDMQKGETKVVLKIPVSRGQSTANSKPQGPQGKANTTGISRFPSVIPRKRIPSSPTLSSSRGQSSCERAVLVNTFPLPPPTLRRRGHGAGPHFVAGQDRTRLSGVDQVPSSVFPAPPQPCPSLMQRGLQRISNPSVENACNENNHDVNKNTTATQLRTPNPSSEQQHYQGHFSSSFTTNAADIDYDSNTTEQNNHGNETMLCVLGFDRTPEELNRSDTHSHITTPSVETSLSHETFYSVPEGSSNRISETAPSTPSSTSCSISAASVFQNNSPNPHLRPRIFGSILNFLSITETGDIARSRRRYVGVGSSVAGTNE